jgi:hypothetical protein
MCLITRMAPVALSCQLREGTAGLHKFKSYSKMDGLVALAMALETKERRRYDNANKPMG